MEKRKKIKKVKNLKWVKRKDNGQSSIYNKHYQRSKPRQQKTMKAHARHHSLKHMRSMARALKKGATFQTAHNRAMRSVGK